jgi:hypothetical protein
MTGERRTVLELAGIEQGLVAAGELHPVGSLLDWLVLRFPGEIVRPGR